MSLTHAKPIEVSGKAEGACRHCGGLVFRPESAFCCNGCETVYGLIHEHGLERYYDLAEAPGIIPSDAEDRYEFLEDEALSSELHDFDLGHTRGITLNIPAIHCAACVWLLEKMHTLHPGIGRSEVNFGRRQLRLQYKPTQLSLQELAGLLDRLGYAPVFSLQDGASDKKPDDGEMKRLLLRLGVAGFCFGNIMLFAFPFYLGLEPGSSPQAWSFTILSGILSLPVLLYSADVYWKKALADIRARQAGIDVPVTLGLLAMFVASIADIALGRGEGYFDSLGGLIFFLLCGRVFQRKTFSRMSFDRDYRSYFPLSVRCVRDGVERGVPLSSLKEGDRIQVRSGELIPADSRLDDAAAVMDYSFITGEATPVTCPAGERIYAGARVCGSMARLTVERPVSQSYLTSLWNQDPRSGARSRLRSLTDRISPVFTAVVLAIATVSGIVWLAINPTSAPFVFAAILIIACPCALALSAPFVYGQVIRSLGANGFYLRSADVVEQLAGIRAAWFDKTGTLTSGYIARFHPLAPSAENQVPLIAGVAAHSTHPLSRCIAGAVAPLETESWHEEAGQGIAALVGKSDILFGRREWLLSQNVAGIPDEETLEGQTCVVVAVDGACIGYYQVETRFRQDLNTMFERLRERLKTGLISGDRSEAEQTLDPLKAHLDEVHMEARPDDKADLVAGWQAAHGPVMMVGDGLNDAAALRKSDVGVVVSDDTAMFCPASDMIVEAQHLHQLPRVLTFARHAVRLTLICIGFSLAYNVVGVSIAVAGKLSPLLAAILMPLSSFTIMSLALIGTRVAARRLGLEAA